MLREIELEASPALGMLLRAMLFRRLHRSARATASPALAEKVSASEAPVMPARFSLLPRAQAEPATILAWLYRHSPAPTWAGRVMGAKALSPCRLLVATNRASGVPAEVQAWFMAKGRAAPWPEKAQARASLESATLPT